MVDVEVVVHNTTHVPLQSFGFTPTESKVYAALLSLGPATGYAVARVLAVARANVYQALEGLVRRGAATKSSTRPVRFAAVGPTVLVRALARDFQGELRALEDELSRLARAEQVAETSFLKDADSLDERASSVADAAGDDIVVLTGPWAPRLSAAVERAVRRQASVRALALASPAPIGAVLRETDIPSLEAVWGGLPAAVAGVSSALWGVVRGDGGADGMVCTTPGTVAFVRHLILREIASGGSLLL